MEPTILKTFNVTKGSILCATPFLDDTYVAAGTSSRTVMLFPTKPNLKYRRLVGHRGSVTCLSISSNPVCLASGSEDGTIKLWRIHDNDEVCISIQPREEPITSISLSPNADRVLLSTAVGYTALWDPGMKAVIQIFDNGNEKVNCVALDTQNSLAIAGSGEGCVRIFDVRTGELASRPVETFSAVTAMSLGTSTGQVAVGTLNGSVFVINVRNGHILRNAQVHQAGINGISIQPGGKSLLSGSDDNTVILSDISTMEALYTLPAHKDKVLDVQFSTSGGSFTTCSADQRVILWASPRQERDAVQEEEEEEHLSIIPKTPPVPEEPPAVAKEEVTPDRSASLESVEKPEKATPRVTKSQSLLEISDDDSSEASLPEETPVRGQMNTFVSTICQTPAANKADSPMDTELADLMMQAGERLARIGTKLVDLGIAAKQLDDKIAQLELNVRPHKPTPAGRVGAK